MVILIDRVASGYSTGDAGMTDRAGGTTGTSRRGGLRPAAGALAAGGGLAGPPGPWGPSIRRATAEEGGGERSLIVRSRQPLDLETPTEFFDQFLTPNDLFFVRSHFGAPAVSLGP